MPNSFRGWGAHGREKVPGGQTWQGPPLLRQVPVYPLRNGLLEHSGSTHRAVSHPSPLPILPGSSHFLFLLLLPSQHVFIPLTIFPSSPHLDQENASGGAGSSFFSLWRVRRAQGLVCAHPPARSGHSSSSVWEGHPSAPSLGLPLCNMRVPPP